MHTVCKNTSCVTMNSNPIKTWFLGSYLLVLLNFGPSLHHLPALGFHGVHPAASHCCCACGCSSSEDWELFPRQKNTQGKDVSGFLVDDSGCAFCKFFDDFHVAVALSVEVTAEHSLSVFVAWDESRPIRDVGLCCARGPPTESVRVS